MLEAAKKKVIFNAFQGIIFLIVIIIFEKNRSLNFNFELENVI